MILRDLATIVRSKNAGPLVLTIDILFESDADFRRVRKSEALSPHRLAALLRVPAEKLRIFTDERARAVKISFPRAVVAGAPGDVDVYGAQQHAALLELEI